MKPRDFIHVLEHLEAPPLRSRDERSELLLALLARLFFADRTLADGEVELVQRLAADVPDSRKYIEELAAREFDIDRLGAMFPDPTDRDDIITLAEHAVWGDDQVDSREWDLIDELVEKLGVVRD